jgi:hypothetical protein
MALTGPLAGTGKAALLGLHCHYFADAFIFD